MLACTEGKRLSVLIPVCHPLQGVLDSEIEWPSQLLLHVVHSLTGHCAPPAKDNADAGSLSHLGFRHCRHSLLWQALLATRGCCC